MGEEINNSINEEEIESFYNYSKLSNSLDPNIETISLTENQYQTNIYFKESKKLCYSFEFEINKDKKIYTYRNVNIQEDNEIIIKKFYLLELFFTVPIRFDIRTIKIQNYPIKREELNIYIVDFNRSYQKRVSPQKEIFSQDNLILLSGVYQITIASNNHYIPRGYLREFACEENSSRIYNFRVDETNLEENSGEKPVKIENILYISHFYSLGMELILKNIEDAFYNIRNKIIADNRIRNISYEERISIVRYIFAQYIRTPLERNSYINMAKTILKSTYPNQNIRDEVSIEFNEIYIRRITEESMFKMLFPTEKAYLKLFNFYLKNEWRLIRAEHMDFFTSDNPIILYNNSYELNIDQDYIRSLKTPTSKIFETRRSHGLMEPGIQLYFPLTPKLCLLIYNQQSRQELLTPVKINEQVLLQCYQNILSSNSGIKTFLKRKLNQKRNERETFVNLNFKDNVKEF